MTTIKTRKQIIGECVDTLTVFECTNKIRIGNERDGGYVVMDINGYDFLLSGGVGGDIGFEKSFTDKYNVNCICFDGTEQSGIELTKNEPHIQYINKNVGPINTENISNFDFAFEKYNNIFMKLDIEGAEFDLFHSFTIEQLKKIRQLVMEVHFPHQLYHWQMLEKLSQTHYLIHYHANNNNYVIYNMNHKSIPAVFECTYIRKDLLPNPLLNKEPFPTELDTRNVTGKLDYLIDCPPWVHKYTIHTFGDSHASRGWNDCKNIKINNIGPVLCYSFGKEKLTRCDIRNFDVKDNDIIIFCFGEIDCRCHIHKHISEENTYKMIINDIIDNYINAIKMNVNICKLNFKNICIYNVVPPVEKHNTYENQEYPYLGSDEERKQYVLYFNECIKQKCKENNWIFFDVYNFYIDEKGFLNKKLSDGNVHIRNGVYLQNFINNYLL